MTKINTGIIRQSQIESALQTELLSRDALLWLGDGVGNSPEQISSIARLVALPWKSVLCESTSADLVAAFETWKDHPVLVQRRGYLDVIASNPDQTLLPTRTLPVYLLNGREGSRDPLEGPKVSPQKAFLRRFTMLNSAVASQPTLLVVVSSGDSSTVGNLCELWEEGFRSRVVFVTQNSEEIGDLEVRFVKKYLISALTVIEQSPTQFAEALAGDIHAAVSEDLLLLRIRDRKNQSKLSTLLAARNQTSRFLIVTN